MKKIFLTSGLVLCMACPAFANVEGSLTGTPTATDECVNDVLGTYSGSANLIANWTENFAAITLNPNTSANGAGNPSSVTPTTLWAVPGSDNNAGVYRTRQSNTTSGYDFTGQFASGNAVFGQNDVSPVGKNVNYTIVPNLPQAYNSYTTEQKTAWYTEGGSVQATTAFNGFYADTDTSLSTPLISSTGAITDAGIAAGKSASGSRNWVADYTCGNPSVTLPQLRGYTAAWSTTPGCIKDNADLGVTWTAHTGTITYTCGTKPTGATSDFTTNTTGTISGATTSATYDASFTLPDNAGTCALPGYHFNGWKCNYNLESGNAGDTDYAASGATGTYRVPTAGAAITCNAQWASNGITLNWTDPAGGNSIDPTSCQYDGGITLPSPEPSRPGYTFNGWTVVSQQ